MCFGGQSLAFALFSILKKPNDCLKPKRTVGCLYVVNIISVEDIASFNFCLFTNIVYRKFGSVHIVSVMLARYIPLSDMISTNHKVLLNVLLEVDRTKIKIFRLRFSG